MHPNRNVLMMIFLCLFVAFSCANPGELDPVSDRFKENMDMGEPDDIDPPGDNNFSFAVMGDTHVGSYGSVFRKAVEDSASQGDAFVLVGGDISNNGGKGQFKQFENIFAENDMEYRAALGNHDIYFGGWKHFKDIIGRSIYSFNADNVHIVVLDSANGTFGLEQLRWLDNDLKYNNRRHTIVITHFPPWVGDFSSIFKISSEEEAALFKDIMYKRGVDLMFAAHYHGYKKKKIGKTTYIVTGGANSLLDPGEFKNYIRVRVDGNRLSTEVVSIP